MPPKRAATLEALREKIAKLPQDPGVYLFKDAAGRVLYVGKAANLRSRVASYFQPGANLTVSRNQRIDRMVKTLVEDIDHLVCQSEVDALLIENRLIKDVRPEFNAQLKDGKTYPYLQITTDEPFPRVSITREPRAKGAKLYGPFVSVAELRGALPLLQRVFKFRTCNLDITHEDRRKRKFRPCILHSIKQCTAPCADRVSQEDYKQQITRFRRFLASKGSQLKKELEAEMAQAAKELDFEKAAQLRDELRALDGLQKRGIVEEHVQPEAFYIDPSDSLQRLADALGMDQPPRSLEGIDIAHLAGGELVGSLVMFIDGKPFKDGYRRYKIKTVEGNDDFASIREVVWRRYKHAGMNQELFPDVILIDGGKGQLSAAYSAFDDLAFTPPMLISLAKKEEEVFVHGRQEPLRLSRRDPALRLLQSIRDEAHRFAQHYHHILRRRSMLETNRKPDGNSQKQEMRKKRRRKPKHNNEG
jgi:excinuclease ABC subunit C